MEERIKKIIFQDQEEKLESTWMELNINSIEYVKLIIKIEAEFDFELADEFLVLNQEESIQEFINRIMNFVS